MRVVVVRRDGERGRQSQQNSKKTGLIEEGRGEEGKGKGKQEKRESVGEMQKGQRSNVI